MALVTCPFCGKRDHIPGPLPAAVICSGCHVNYAIEPAPEPKSLKERTRQVVWTLCPCFALIVALLYFLRFHAAENIIQQIGAAADACVWIILVYVLARSSDAVLR